MDSLRIDSMKESAWANLAAATAALGDTDPVALAFYRYLIAAACLTPVLPFVWPRSGVSVGDIGKIAVLGALFFGFFPWAFSASLQFSAMLLAVVLLGESITAALTLGLLVVLCGILIANWPTTHGGATETGHGQMRRRKL